MAERWLASSLIVLALATSPRSSIAQADEPEIPRGETAAEPTAPEVATLAGASRVEKQTLQTLLEGNAWSRRALGVLRLDRYGCGESQTILDRMATGDPGWQVRCFAIRGLALRGALPDAARFAGEGDLRVVRAALRHGVDFDHALLEPLILRLAKSRELEEKLFSAELAAAVDDEELREEAKNALKTVILRMKRTEAGMFSPRIARVCNSPEHHRPHEWQRWLMKEGRGFALVEPKQYLIAPGSLAPSPLAALPPEAFSGLEDYIKILSTRDVDLAVVLDCTASMWGEIEAAQAGVDDLMLFVGDVVRTLRVGIVGYRDRRDEFETKGWDFTADRALARERLWQLTADGGGDGPEAVYEALQLAYTQLTWVRSNTSILVLIGDAPPHVGRGVQCADMARRAEENQCTTHVIEAEGKEVKHFAGIAEAGGGRCIPLEDDESLILEIAGLTLGDRYKDELGAFFRLYLDLCR